MLSNLSVKGKRILVTGGGSGIGRAMVEEFLLAGASVVAADIRTDRLEQLAGELPDVETVAADVSTPAGADQVIEAAGTNLDVLCNNAAIIDDMSLAGDMSEEIWNAVIAVDLTAPFLLCKRALPNMVAQGSGVIINTGSTAATRGARGGPAYTAAKWGLLGLTQNIAATYGPRGIRCVMVSPGGIKTNLTGDLANAPVGGATQLMNQDTMRPPIGRPEQIATVALFLAGDGASRVNGVNVPVDLGWQAY